MATQDKITFFLPDLDAGGAQKVFFTLAKEFHKNKKTIDLLASDIDGPFQKDVPECVNLVNLNNGHATSSNSLLAIYSFLGLVKYLRKHKPYCIISTLTGANLLVLMVKILTKTRTRIIIREANTLLNLSNPMYKKLMQWLYPMADGIIAVSDGVATDLASKLNISKEKIRVINNPVDINETNKLAIKKALHPWLDNASSVPVILGIGRLVSQKDFECLIRAFMIVRKEVECRLIILGEGKFRKALSDYAKNSNLDKDISLPGFSPYPFYFMKRASVFVLSSKWEGFPNVLLQALALGTPVVATDCHSGPRQILQDGKYGELVTVGDSRAMAKAINKTIKRPAPEIAFLQEAVRQYSPEIIAAQYASMIADIYQTN